MQKQDIIRFFDQMAPQWDADMVRSDENIGIILDHAGVQAGAKVLDVACGTGVLIPDYLARNVESVVGIDIAPEMIRIAREKFSQQNVRLICGDIETQDVGAGFSAIVVYNAFPHFSDPERLVHRLSTLLAPGGVLTVAHGMSRDAINGHHAGMASKVSVDLMEATALAAIFSKELAVTTVVSNEGMYQVAGTRRA